jgi:hypothetical protein
VRTYGIYSIVVELCYQSLLTIVVTFVSEQRPGNTSILVRPGNHTTLMCRRVLSSLVHLSVGVCLLAATRTTDLAPCTSSVLRYASPRLLMPSNNGFPPLECCLGTSPNQAASYRPFLKHRASPIDAACALAVNTPTPGMPASRWLSVLLLCQVAI